MIEVYRLPLIYIGLALQLLTGRPGALTISTAKHLIIFVFYDFLRRVDERFHRENGKSSFYCILLGCCFVTQSCSTLVAPWTLAPLSVGFRRQEYWSRLPCPPPEDHPDPGTEPMSPALQVDSLLSEPPGNSYTTQQATANMFTRQVCPNPFLLLHLFYLLRRDSSVQSPTCISTQSAKQRPFLKGSLGTTYHYQGRSTGGPTLNSKSK